MISEYIDSFDEFYKLDLSFSEFYSQHYGDYRHMDCEVGNPFEIFPMLPFCFMLMLTWCDNLCHTCDCLDCTKWLPCQMISNAPDFLYDDHVICPVYSWFFPRLFESFLIWCAFVSSDVSMWSTFACLAMFCSWNESG